MWPSDVSQQDQLKENGIQRTEHIKSANYIEDLPIVLSELYQIKLFVQQPAKIENPKHLIYCSVPTGFVRNMLENAFSCRRNVYNGLNTIQYNTIQYFIFKRGKYSSR